MVDLDVAYLDAEVYDDDEPGFHPLDDDDFGRGDGADASAPAREPSSASLLHASQFGSTMHADEASSYALDGSYATCFSEAYLKSIAGCDDLTTCATLEMRADCTREDLGGVGRAMPSLARLRMSNSVAPSMRTFGSAFQRLTVLWISRSGLEDLAGIGSLLRLRELYASYNEVADVSPLAELDDLRVVDLEGNRVADPDAPDYLGMCPKLTSVTLEGNPLSRVKHYRRLVARAMPGLRALDDVDVSEEDRAAIVGDADAGGKENENENGRGDRKGGVGDGETSDAEMAMVTEGIKYAAVGIDDPDAVLTRDAFTGELSIELAEDPLGGDEFGLDAAPPLEDHLSRMALRPPPRPGSSQGGGPSRPSSGASSAGSGMHDSTSALVRCNSLGATVRTNSRPNTAASNASGGGSARGWSSRPGTAASIASTSSSRPGTAASGRPGTATSWRSRAASARSRPGTAASSGSGGSGGGGWGSRPGTAMSAGDVYGRPESADSLFWRKNRVKESRAGLSDRGDTANGWGFGLGDSCGGGGGGGSALTAGEGIVVGNPTKLLARRKRERAAAANANGADATNAEAGGEAGGARANEEEDILTSLRRWKIEMAETFSRRGLLGADELEFAREPPPLEYKYELEPERGVAEPAATPSAAPAPPMDLPTPPKFTPQPPPQAPPRGAMRPQPPSGRPRGPRPGGPGAGRSAKAVSAADAAAALAAPPPKRVTESSAGGVDRLVFD